jgi:hypothetical protein
MWTTFFLRSKSLWQWYCTMLAVLVRDYRLSHLFIHSLYSRLHRRYYTRSVTNSRTVEFSTPFLFEGQLITS